jgi:hypothetical protein
VELKTYADFIRLTNLPKAIKPEFEEQDFYFWAPAFRAPPTMTLRFARNATVAQAETADHVEHDPDWLAACNLPSSEAAEVMKTLLASTSMVKSNIFPRLPEIAIEAEETLLVYVPFERSGREIICPRMQLSLNPSVLGLFART